MTDAFQGFTSWARAAHTQGSGGARRYQLLADQERTNYNQYMRRAHRAWQAFELNNARVAREARRQAGLPDEALREQFDRLLEHPVVEEIQFRATPPANPPISDPFAMSNNVVTVVLTNLDLDLSDGSTRRVGELRIASAAEIPLDPRVYRASWGPGMEGYVPQNDHITAHPHVHANGAPCWGDAATGIGMYPADGDFYMYFMQVIEFLRQVHERDAWGRRVLWYPLAPGSAQPGSGRRGNVGLPHSRWLDHTACPPAWCRQAGIEGHESNLHDDCDPDECWSYAHDDGEHENCDERYCMYVGHYNDTSHENCDAVDCWQAGREECQAGNHEYCEYHHPGEYECPRVVQEEEHVNGHHENCNPDDCMHAQRMMYHNQGNHDLCAPFNCEVLASRERAAQVSGVTYSSANPFIATDATGIPVPVPPLLREEGGGQDE